MLPSPVNSVSCPNSENKQMARVTYAQDAQGLRNDKYTPDILNLGTGRENPESREQPHSRSTTLPITKPFSESRAYLDTLINQDFSKPTHSKEKYFAYCQDFQVLSRGLRDENAKLTARVASLETPKKDYSMSTTSSSRKTTEDLTADKKRQIEVPKDETAVVFSLIDYDVRLVQGSNMSSHYDRVHLPRFHWWNDTIYVYFRKSSSLNLPLFEKSTKSHENSWVLVLSKRLELTKERDVRYIRTIRLGKLGWRFKAKRIFGEINHLYIEIPRRGQL